jgi:hypothetical protein
MMIQQMSKNNKNTGQRMADPPGAPGEELYDKIASISAQRLPLLRNYPG